MNGKGEEQGDVFRYAIRLLKGGEIETAIIGQTVGHWEGLAGQG